MSSIRVIIFLFLTLLLQGVAYAQGDGLPTTAEKLAKAVENDKYD